MKLLYYALLLKAGLSLPTPQQQQQYNDMQAYQNFLLPALNSIFNQYSANYQENESSEYSLLDVNNSKALHQEQPSNNNIWFRGSNSNTNTNTNTNANISSNSNTNNSNANSNASNARTNPKPEDKKETPESSQRDPSTQKQNSPINNTSRSPENKPAETQPNNNISSDKTEKKDTNKKDLTPTTTTTAIAKTTTTTTTTSSSSKPTATSGNAEHKESIDMMPSDEVRDIWTKWI